MIITIDLSSIIGEKDQCRAYQVVKDQVEKAFVIELLKQANNNKLKAARIAGINAGTIYKKLRRYGLCVDKRVVQCGCKS